MDQLENQDLLDYEQAKTKYLWTIRLLIISVIMIALTFLVSSFWLELGLSQENTSWLAVSLIISFGVNVVGLVYGIIERKKNKLKALIGMIGNALLVAFFLYIVIYSIFLMVEGTVPA